jgi:hypothetical protein
MIYWNKVSSGFTPYIKTATYYTHFTSFLTSSMSIHEFVLTCSAYFFFYIVCCSSLRDTKNTATKISYKGSMQLTEILPVYGTPYNPVLYSVSNKLQTLFMQSKIIRNQWSKP